jgi:hypothetical protein
VTVTPIHADDESHLIDWETFGRTTGCISNLYSTEILRRIYRNHQSSLLTVLPVGLGPGVFRVAAGAGVPAGRGLDVLRTTGRTTTGRTGAAALGSEVAAALGSPVGTPPGMVVGSGVAVSTGFDSSASVVAAPAVAGAAALASASADLYL